MAASVTTAATTIEGQLLEVSHRLQLLELALPEIQRPNNIGIAYDLEANNVTITATLPITQTVGTDGKPNFMANPYL